MAGKKGVFICCVLLPLLLLSSCGFIEDMLGTSDNSAQGPRFSLQAVDSATIRVNLVAVPDAANYVIERSSTQNGSYAEVYRGTELSFTDSGLMANTSYFYKAYAILSNNEHVSFLSTSGSSFISASTLPAMAPPENVQASLVMGTGISYTVQVSWNEAAEADYYKIYYTNSYPPEDFSDADNFTEVIFPTAINSNSVTITSTELSFDESTRYYFYVRAGQTGASLTNFSETEAFVTTPGAAWNPSDVEASLSQEGRIVLSWSDAPNAERYWVYRDTVENGSYTKIDDIPDTVDPESGAVQYVDTAVATNTTYFYKIVGINSTFGPDDEADIRQNVLSFVDSVRVNSSLPEPANVSGSYTSGSGIQLTWSAISGATAYKVYRSIYEDTGFEVITTAVSNSTLDNNQILSGMTYYYKVTALDEASAVESGFSTTVAVPVSQILNPPSNVTATPQSDTRISLSWAVPQGVSETLYYDVYYRDGQNWVLSVADRPSNEATITSLQASTSYAFKVQAKTAAGAQSSFSNVAEVTTLPANPVVTAVSGGSSTIDLSWSVSPGAEGYNVYLATSSGGSYTKRTDTAVTGTSYIVTGLSQGATYYFKVTALAGGYEPLLAYVNEVSCTTDSLAAPEVTSVTYGSGQVTVNWNSANFATAYEVSWSTSALSNFQIATPSGGVSATSFSFTPTGVSSGYVYVKVRSRDEAGGISAWTNSSDSVLIQ